ncbi:MAG: hypothetical protein ACT4QC_02420 [Planctomycetaceae bacterium]
MSVDSELFEEIVRRVVEALAPPATGARPTTTSRDQEAHAFDHPVITREVLEQSVNGAPAIRVRPRAVLTPSARDFVRERGLVVVRETAPRGAKSSPQWLLLVTSASPIVGGALDELSSIAGPLNRRLLGGPSEAASQAISALCRGETQNVGVITAEPELVACLANRNERVRAVAIADSSAWERARRSVKPNLVAIDPSKRSQFELRQILRAMVVGT